MTASQSIIGIAGPFTGPRRDYGNLIKDVVHSIGETPFEKLFLDDEADPKIATKVAHEFISKKVKAVIGHFNSECARVAGGLYREAGIPFLMPASTAPGLDQEIDSIRLCPDDNQQIEACSEWLNSVGGRCRIWSDESRYGDRLKMLLSAKLDADQIELDGLDGRDSTTVLFGSHYKVASRINEMWADGCRGSIVACDDCAIGEFPGLINSACTGVFVATPTPTFDDALAAGLSHLCEADLSKSGDELLVALRNQIDQSTTHKTNRRFQILPLDNSLDQEPDYVKRFEADSAQYLNLK